MSEIVPVRDNPLTTFIPEKTKQNQAKADALIDYAIKVKDWPLVEQAIDAKIEEQKKFVEWWTENVRRPGRVKHESN
jgi:hypothetical protein